MALEPDLGFPTPATNPFADQTTTRFGSQVAPINPFSPIAPNLPDELQARINANVAGEPEPAPAPDTTGLDTSAIIPNLPNAQGQFVAKYKRLGPSVQQLPQDVKASLLQIDYDRVQKGQSPLNDKETLGAIVSVMKKGQATPQAEDHSILHTIKNLPGAAVDDAATVLKSLPHLPGAIVKEVQSLPRFAAEMDEATKRTGNGLSGLAEAPGIRMLPGAFTVSNLAQGPDGIRTILEHPVMTGLDVLPYASKAASATKVGALAEAEGINPVRATLTRSALPEGELSITGSRLTPMGVGKATDYLARNTKPGRFMVETWGRPARMESSIYNIGDHRLQEVLMGNSKLNNTSEKAVREAYGFAVDQQQGKFNLPTERVVEIGKVLQQDRNLLADATKFTDADRAFASRYIELQQKFQEQNVALGALSKFGGEVYDAKTGKFLSNLQTRLGKASTRVEEGMYAKIEAARQEIAAHVEKHGPTPINKLAEKRIAEVWSLMDDHFNNFDSTVTMADIEKATQGIARFKSRPLVIGGKEAPIADMRMDSFIKLRGEVRTAAALEKKLAKEMGKAPARWHTTVQNAAKESAEQQLIQAGINPAEAVRVVAERDFAAFPELYNSTVLKDIISDIEPTWRDLKAAGVDPVFMHRVSPGGERALALPRTRDFIGELSQNKARSILDPTPYNQDITVGLAHQAVEIASQRISSQVLAEIGELRGVTAAELYQRYANEARRKAGQNVTYDFDGHVRDLIQKDWQVYEPTSFTKGTPRSSIAFDANSEQIWIPRATAKVMEQFYNRTPNAILSTMAPITGIFRTAVLPLSPRWHLNNIVGNTMMTLLEDPKALLQFPEAWKAVKAAKAGEEVLLPDSLKYSFNLNRQELAQAAYESGNRLGGYFKQLQDAKTTNPAAKVIQKSYDFNSAFDDVARTMTYLNEMKKGTGRKALTADAAAVEALHTTNRVFQDWNALTPVERNVLRQIFPFYSFTSHVIRFVTSYPGTHPLRTAIMANIANSIATDMKEEGIPKSMLDYLSLGKADELGHQDWLSLRGINPLSDTANQFTLAGFMAGINPLGQAVATSLGADISGYGVNSRQTYDPDTGKLTDSKPGFVQSLIASTIPQLGTAQRAAGMDSEYNALLRTNPDAARRLLVSGLGIPTMKRQMSIPVEQMKAEVNRQTAQRKVLADALQTGDYSEAMKWPNLVPYIQQIKILRDRRALGAYNPQAGASGGFGSIPQAVGSVTPWPT